MDDETHKPGMVKIKDLIADMQAILDRFGNTCVYIRPRGLSWGAVALNYQAEDEQNGVFDLKEAFNRDREAHAGQVKRLMEDRDHWMMEAHKLRKATAA